MHNSIRLAESLMEARRHEAAEIRRARAARPAEPRPSVLRRLVAGFAPNLGQRPALRLRRSDLGNDR